MQTSDRPTRSSGAKASSSSRRACSVCASFRACASRASSSRTSLIGPTWPNRFYFFGATSWGRTNTPDTPPRNRPKIMNLLEKLRREKNLTYLFISHDLRAIRHVSDRVAVMYLGKLVELAGAKTIYEQPLMPYTQALISAVPVPDPQVEATRQRIMLEGDVPSPINPPSGCRFHTRCPYAIEACKEVVPQLVEIKPRHFAACIRISPAQPHIEEVPPGAAPGL